MWVTYRNGNYDVRLNLSDGTKIRYNDSDFFHADRPESMDITISTYCEMGCEFCYAGCSKNGKHADIMYHSFIDNLEPYTELALNGNEPLHPDLVPFLYKCRELKLIPSLTVNQHTFMKNIELLKALCDQKLIYGLGISLSDPTDEFIEEVSKFPNAVVHVINGIITMDKLRYMAHKGLKILILGYKSIRRGKSLYKRENVQIEQLKSAFYDVLQKVIEEEWFEVISFDNLAIEQLDVKRLMSDEEWRKFYLGDDGTHTFYVNLVDGTFSKSSIETKCFPIMDDATKMFNIARELK